MNSLLEAQEQSISYEVKGRKQNKRLPWLNNKILEVLKSKKDAYQLWKHGKIAIKGYKNLARTCRDAVLKAKAQLELKLVKRGVKKKKQFFRCISTGKIQAHCKTRQGKQLLLLTRQRFLIPSLPLLLSSQDEVTMTMFMQTHQQWRKGWSAASCRDSNHINL